jgi:hypothetical protein
MIDIAMVVLYNINEQAVALSGTTYILRGVPMHY